MNKKKYLKLLKSILLVLLLLYLLFSLYLTFKIDYFFKSSYKDEPYVSNSFISEELYNKLNPLYANYNNSINKSDYSYYLEDYNTYFFITLPFFDKTNYYKRFKYEFKAYNNYNEEQEYYLTVSMLCVNLEFSNFKWHITNVYEKDH